MIAATFPRVVDSTIRSDFLLCPHLFFRKRCQGLVKSAEKDIALHFGGCVARGLEVTRRAYCSGMSQGNAILVGAEQVVIEWGDYVFNPRKRSEENKDLDNCLLAVADYFAKWPLDSDAVQIHTNRDAICTCGPANGWRDCAAHCIEFSGAAPIPGTEHPETGEPIIYAGRFDLIGDYAGGVWGLDDKTTSSLGGEWDKQWDLRGQFTGYTWLAKQYNMSLQGFQTRGIQPLKEKTNFADALTPRPPWMIDRWLVTLQHDIARMIQCWHAYNDEPWAEDDCHPFPQILDAGCFNYHRPCEMMPLCTSEHPERWEQDYTVQHWNPLERGTQ